MSVTIKDKNIKKKFEKLLTRNRLIIKFTMTRQIKIASHTVSCMKISPDNINNIYYNDYF